MQASMSRRGNCGGGERGARSLLLGHNAPMESFFGTLKTERLPRYRLATREGARRVVFEDREVFYNRIRRHDKIGNQSPAD